MNMWKSLPERAVEANMRIRFKKRLDTLMEDSFVRISRQLRHVYGAAPRSSGADGDMRVLASSLPGASGEDGELKESGQENTGGCL
ncbi:hypothetical protein Y1Q_0014550 [Alligator mississippiensis]|uniref:Uncharacterized protein n=1 Tax=Alligator mississippiensis TaxID=8496 RepID=A0A151PD69_ALLMI|nr:hypothetical protein Y1Q_0014550 [Alligator mississippiensis]